MKRLYFIGLYILSVGFQAGTGFANPVDLSAPGGELGAASPKGYLEIWREIDGVGMQLGKGSYLPFRYKFSSDPAIKGILGPGFYVPMFEARNMLIREGTMRAYLPCGKGLYLWRDDVDSHKFQTPDKEWTGYVTGNDFIVWRNDGWKILYHDSRLTSITSDEKRTFTWNYDIITGGAGITENGQSIIAMEPGTAGQVAAFIFDGKRYKVEYGERPITQILVKQVVVKELDPALSSFKYPDGSADTFKFEMTPQRIPTLTFANKDGQQTAYSWDPKTYHIATEKGATGDWTYEIGDIAQNFDLPSISRGSSDGRTEGLTIDSQKGTYTSTAVDGTVTVTHVFETPGPLYHKVKSIEKTVNGQTTTISKASYDEAGRLIRKVDERGFITLFTYKDDIIKTSIGLTQNPEILAQLQQKEKEIKDVIENALTTNEKQDAIRSLAQFYMFGMLDNAKALSLVSQLDHSHAYMVRLQGIDNDSSLSIPQKRAGYQALLKEYPEYKDQLEFLINAN